MTAAATSMPRPRLRVVSWTTLPIMGLCAAILVLFIIYPMSKTALSAFLAKNRPFAFGNLTFDNFRAFVTSPLYHDALLHSLFISFCTTLLATAIALPAAYAIARVDVKWRGFALSLSVIPLISPPFIGAYSWVILLGNNGIVTQLMRHIGIELPGIYGPGGIILALSLHLFPYVLLFTQSALSVADPAIEESARVMGASNWRIVRTVTMPLVLPAILSGMVLTFAMSLGDFGVAAILGGEYYVLTTLIYLQLNSLYNINGAAAIAMVSISLMIICLLLSLKATKRGRYTTISSTSRGTVRASGRSAKLAGGLYVWGLLSVAMLPQVVIVFDSFSTRWIGTIFPTQFGLANYLTVFSELREAFANTFILSGAATILCVIFGTIAAYGASQKGFRGRSLLDATIMIPFLMPGLITGVAFLTSFNTGLLVLTNTAAIIVLGYFIKRMAYTYRAVSAALSQMDRQIEEASLMCGAGPLTTMRRITIPLIMPAIMAGGILVFSTLISDLNLTILLYSANWKTATLVIFDKLNQNQIELASAIGSVAIVLTVTFVFVASRLIGKSMAEMFK